MYDYIKGELKYIKDDCCVIECNGIGFKLFFPSNLYIGNIEDEVKMNVVEIHRDDGIDLYGFPDNSSRSLFLSLLKISKIGPKLGLKIISTYKVEEFINYVVNENLKAINAISGVGKKTAERIVLELKDKLDDISLIATNTAKVISTKTEEYDRIYNELFNALISLGYSKILVRKKLEKVLSEYEDISKVNVTDILEVVISGFYSS